MCEEKYTTTVRKRSHRRWYIHVINDSDVGHLLKTLLKWVYLTVYPPLVDHQFRFSLCETRYTKATIFTIKIVWIRNSIKKTLRKRKFVPLSHVKRCGWILLYTPWILWLVQCTCSGSRMGFLLYTRRVSIIQRLSGVDQTGQRWLTLSDSRDSQLTSHVVFHPFIGHDITSFK